MVNMIPNSTSLPTHKYIHTHTSVYSCVFLLRQKLKGHASDFGSGCLYCSSEISPCILPIFYVTSCKKAFTFQLTVSKTVVYWCWMEAVLWSAHPPLAITAPVTILLIRLIVQ